MSNSNNSGTLGFDTNVNGNNNHNNNSNTQDRTIIVTQLLINKY